MYLVCKTFVNALGVPFNAPLTMLLNCVRVLVADCPAVFEIACATILDFMLTDAQQVEVLALRRDVVDPYSADILLPARSRISMSMKDALKAETGSPLASLST